MDIETRLDEFVRVVEFQCPAEFWPALGYTGEARYVAVYWEPAGDEACWADGREALCGAEYQAFFLLLDFNFPPGRPEHWLFGTSESPATFWLVIDRESEEAWCVPADAADGVLRQQWPVKEVAPLPSDSMEEWLEMLRREARVRPVVDVEGLMVERQRRYETLLAAMEKRRPGWTERPWW